MREGEDKRAWMAPRHKRVSVISVMELCWPEHHVLECLFASHSPSEEARFWVAVYEHLCACFKRQGGTG